MWSPCNTLNTKTNSPGGIEPQPIKLEFTIYPAELWIYFRFARSPTAHLDLLRTRVHRDPIIIFGWDHISDPAAQFVNVFSHIGPNCSGPYAYMDPHMCSHPIAQVYTAD